GVLVNDLYVAIERDYLINKKRTLRNVKGAWRKHLSGVFGSQPIVPFRPSRVSSYILARQKEEAANATINRELAVLKRMAALAIENYEAEVEDEKLIAALVRWAKIKPLDESDNVREQIFPTELYDAFARETAKVGLWFRTMFELSYARGWRPKSAKQLQVKQIDLMRRTIRLTAKMTKNKKPCEIGMTDTEYELLRQSIAGKGPEDLVITRQRDALGRRPRNGGRIVDFRKDWKKVCEAVGVTPGLDGLIFYDLKRAGVTNLIDDGFDVKEAMTITGHATESAFRRYHKVSAPKLQDAARRIERGHRERQRAARYQQEEMFGEKIPPGRAS
ncbi:MAG: integrase family protein, partial [Bryobacterales bacterium]|nr:integrase family protein [Bryobacterales bacterium]